MENVKEILNMLKEGKISVDEAERLIRAIGETKKKETRTGIGGLVESILDKTFSLVSSVTGIKFKEVKPDNLEGYFIINAYSGDVEIKTDKDTKIEPREYTSFSDEKIVLPENANVYVRCMGGDVEIEGKFNNVYLNSYGGDIEFRGDFEHMEILAYGGDCELKINCDDLTIEVENFGGNLKFPIGYRKEGKNYIYGSGRKFLKVLTYGGDIKVKS